MVAGILRQQQAGQDRLASAQEHRSTACSSRAAGVHALRCGGTDSRSSNTRSSHSAAPLSALSCPTHSHAALPSAALAPASCRWMGALQELQHHCATSVRAAPPWHHTNSPAAAHLESCVNTSCLASLSAASLSLTTYCTVERKQPSRSGKGGAQQACSTRVQVAARTATHSKGMPGGQPQRSRQHAA